MSTTTIETADGHALVARFHGEAQRAHGGVLIVPAMGVHQRYYAPFAHWLAEQGYLVATFDYRGTGESRRGPLKGFAADLDTWAQQDCAAMLAALHARLPGKPLFWLGHSLGGQLLGLVPNQGLVRGAVTVATGSGYWRENSPALRRTVWWLWYVAAPLAMKLYGYFPGKRLRKVGDLPLGVMRQWRSWCLHPHYAVGVEGERASRGYAAFRAPLLSLSFEDDEYMSARNTASLHGFYTNARTEHQRLAPHEVGARRIGHFGFFRETSRHALWPRVTHWIQTAIEQESS